MTMAMAFLQNIRRGRRSATRPQAGPILCTKMRTGTEAVDAILLPKPTEPLRDLAQVTRLKAAHVECYARIYEELAAEKKKITDQMQTLESKRQRCMHLLDLTAMVNKTAGGNSSCHGRPCTPSE